MSLLDDRALGKAKAVFKDNLVDEVNLIVFSQEFECPYCRQVRELAEQLSAISDRVRYCVYDLRRNSDKASEYSIDKIPAIVVVGKRKYGIRFFGVPAGYEFLCLLEAVVDVSRNTSGISNSARTRIREVSKKVHIQVFTSPTNPYCYGVLRLAHQFAVENELIMADMVDSIMFPHLVNKYAVMAVPKVVINESYQFVGDIVEQEFVDQVMVAVKATPDRLYI
ncbi:MAG: thioredoxin family protein [Candidatus Bathyarchaeia archaeon]